MPGGRTVLGLPFLESFAFFAPGDVKSGGKRMKMKNGMRDLSLLLVIVFVGSIIIRGCGH